MSSGRGLLFINRAVTDLKGNSIDMWVGVVGTVSKIDEQVQNNNNSVSAFY